MRGCRVQVLREWRRHLLFRVHGGMVRLGVAAKGGEVEGKGEGCELECEKEMRLNEWQGWRAPTDPNDVSDSARSRGQPETDFFHSFSFFRA